MDSNKGSSSRSWSSRTFDGKKSGGGTRRHSSSSGTPASGVCRCGYYLVTRTAWTTSNPGRRFRGCPGTNGRYCEAFEWTDPPMCARSTVVIPGLLKKLNVYEKKLEEVEMLRAELRKACAVKRTLLLLIAIDMELTLLDAVVDLIEHGLAEPRYPDMFSIQSGMNEVNRRFGTSFNYRFFEEKERILYERFLLFSYVVEMPEEGLFEGIHQSTGSCLASAEDHIPRSNPYGAAHDQCFIDALQDSAFEGKTHEDGLVNDEALTHATEMVNLVMKEAFTIDQNRARLEKLRERYTTFKFLIEHPEVYWDRQKNTMHATCEFWEEIVKTYPLAKAYEIFGDPNWGPLQFMFMRQSIPNEFTYNDEAGPSNAQEEEADVV
ncbi:UNVERIFIED_CONTAM: hypothetical protein Slati_0945500 [Sesamum latifolium]|uniref:GRF-type domain-containing protein n=1 Tax=Sesamum latifolium TaxID=2727402 RepID=A0AAW2XQE4_9LAMI